VAIIYAYTAEVGFVSLELSYEYVLIDQNLEFLDPIGIAHCMADQRGDRDIT
jgi:hypothetical protein